MANDDILNIRTGLNPLANGDRITTSVTVYHEHYGEDPRTVNAVKSRMLLHQVEPYTRRCQVGFQWKRIDLGPFIDEPELVGTVLIENLEGKTLTENPSPEQAKDIAARYIEYGYASSPEKLEPEQAVAYTPPGELEIIRPIDVSRLRIRAKSELRPLGVDEKFTFRVHVISK